MLKRAEVIAARPLQCRDVKKFGPDFGHVLKVLEKAFSGQSFILSERNGQF